MKFSTISVVLSIPGASHARELRRANRSSKATKFPDVPGDAVVVAGAYADGLCNDYCTDYFDKCANWNIYLNPEGKSYAVSGITTQETDLPRNDNVQSLADAKTECLKTCMTWPRPIDPLTFASGDGGTNIFNSRLGGDTLWCRQTHLSLAGNSNDAAFHCGHGTNPSLGICRDALVDGYTPYEWLRDGADTQHRLPFCDVANNGKVVDCTMGGVNTDNLAAVLESLPGTMEILFLNGNQITSITRPLAYNLTNPLNLKALYLNDNGLEELASDTLEGLDNLEVFNADENSVEVLADDFLSYTPKLKQFSMFHNYKLFSPSIPATFFHHTTALEVISLYGTGITNFTEHTFDGLHNVTMFSFVTNAGITIKSFPAGLFNDLTSVQFFDFFLTGITEIPAGFFGPWASNILRLAFWGCKIDSVDENAGLEHLTSIEMAYFHSGSTFDNFAEVSNILTGINPLVTFTYGTYGGDGITNVVE